MKSLEQAIWDRLHDTLMLPRTTVRRTYTGGDMLGEKLRGHVLTDQRNVQWKERADWTSHIDALAQRILFDEPVLFGWLPIPRGLEVIVAVNLYHPSSPVRIRAIQMRAGPYALPPFEPFELMTRVDYLASVKHSASAAA